MKLFILTISLLLSWHANAVCDADYSTFLKANYTIERFKGFHKLKTVDMQLIRKDRWVAHHYPVTNITEAWYLDARKRIKPTRYFDSHKRAIEYQATETVHGKQEKDWNYRNSLISDALRQKMTLTNTSGHGCDTVESYSLVNGTASIVLEWLPELALIRSLEIKQQHQKQVWTLQSSTRQKHDIIDFFAQRESYQTTDYADIGDDHTDPFLTKMVTLGFIEHGASGFYNDKGQALGGSHIH